MLVVALLLFWKGFTQENSTTNFPRIKTYMGILHPIVSYDKEGFHTNFSKKYIVGFPIGINILKSERFGFSFEVVPFIKAEEGKDEVNNVLFHPGIIFRFKNGYSFIPRLAFETSGRYGVTPIISKVFHKNEDYNLFVSVPLPVRFGDEKPVSVSSGILIGIAF